MLGQKNDVIRRTISFKDRKLHNTIKRMVATASKPKNLVPF